MSPLLYNPGNSVRFHSTACITIQRAQQKGTIKNFRQVPDNTKIFRMYGQKPQALTECKNCIANKFPPQPINIVWNGITMPPEINNNEILPDCFLLYLPDVPSKGFHFMKCKNVCYDEKINWLGGYRFTNKAWFEDFKGNIIDVKPCRDCLSEWDNGNGWKNFNKLSTWEQNKIVKYNFCIDDFFRYCLDYRQKNNEFPPDLIALYKLKDDNKIFIGADIDNKYPTNWKELSDAYRKSRNYRCEECKVDLQKQTNLCVTHHINGCHFDVRPENMKVLCAHCHSQKPYHKQATTQDLNLLEQLWREQNII